VDTVSGHVVVRPLDYPSVGLTHPVDDLLDMPPKLESWLNERSLQWTKRTLFVSTLISGPDSMRVRTIAYDPIHDAEVFLRGAWQIKGSIPSTAEQGVLLSQGVARILKIETGQSVVFRTRTTAGAINALALPVAGIVSVGNPMVDKFGVLMTDSLARELIQHGQQFSHLAIRLARRADTESAAQALHAQVPATAEVSTWEEEARDWLAIQKIRLKALNFLVLVLLGIATASIANTILMAAHERIREIGTLQALGMIRTHVIGLFIVEGAMMGVAGSLIGVLIGGSLSRYFSTNGINLAGAVDKVSGGNIPISTMLYFEFSWLLLLLAASFGVLIATLASIYPALIASSRAPAEAIRSA